jgi:hypothetical protein
VNPKPTSLWRRIIREILTPPALVLAALLILWEEVLWVWLGRGMARLGLLGPVSRVETKIKALSPYSALAFFLVPLALTYVPKLLALWLIASGHFLTGMILLACMEVLAAAILARVYALCAPALRTLNWFAWSELRLMQASHWAHDRLGIGEFRRAVSEATSEMRRAPDHPFDQGGLT